MNQVTKVYAIYTYKLFSLEVYPDLSSAYEKASQLVPIFLATNTSYPHLVVATRLILVTSLTKLKVALELPLHFPEGSATTHKRDKILTFPENLFNKLKKIHM